MNANAYDPVRESRLEQHLQDVRLLRGVVAALGAAVAVAEHDEVGAVDWRGLRYLTEHAGRLAERADSTAQPLFDEERIKRIEKYRSVAERL